MKKRAADIIIETLVKRGITECFAVVGGGAMHLDNALGINSSMHKTFNHHEQACAMAADAYARIADKPAAVCVTSGPGATNAITGVMGAWVDSIPMIVVSGQVRYAISVENSGLPLRYRGIQEFDIISSVKNMTKYAKMITDPLAVRREVNKAVDIATTGRRGPVWLDIPLDTQSAIVETDDLYPDEPKPAEPTATTQQVKDVLNMLKNAKRPAILVGCGVESGGVLERFRSFAKKSMIPIVAASMASDILPVSYEKFYGTCGIDGPRPGNFIIQNADVILALGSSLGFVTTGFDQSSFAPKAHIISVDVDENEVKKPGVRVDTFIHSSLEAFFDKLTDENLSPAPEWLDYCAALKKRFSPFDPADNISMNDRVCAYWFWKKFEEAAPPETVCVLGNNTASSSKFQAGTLYENQRIIANRNCGSMGYDLPAAIGTAVSGRQTICLTGDGSIMMNLQELQTIKHYNLPIKIVVFENDGYNAIRLTSENFFDGFLVGCNAESGVSFPSFEEVAKLFGMKYRCCSTNGETAECLDWLFKTDGHVLLEVKQQIHDPMLPKLMSRKREDGSMTAPALQDMYPFLSEEEMERWMAISKESTL